MGHIIKMHSKDFVGDFVKRYDPSKFTIMLISDDITKKKNSKYKNLFKLESLIPPPNAYNELFIKESMKKFKKKYIKYLSYDEQIKLLSVIVKASSIDDEDIILLVSKDEYKSGYLNILCDHLESLFDVKICTYKEFVKNPDKFDNKENAKKISKKLQGILGQKFKTHKVPKGEEKVRNELKKMKRKKLEKICKDLDIKVKDDMSKKDLIKKISKEL